MESRFFQSFSEMSGPGITVVGYIFGVRAIVPLFDKADACSQAIVGVFDSTVRVSQTPSLVSSFANRGSWTWSLCSNLSLPLPTWLPMAVLFLPIAFSFCIYLAVFLRDKGSAIFKTLPVALVYAAASVLIVLFTLSCVYFAPNHLRALSLEWKWSELFRAKDETSVQLIQAQLECCGLNNMHDRAWPFPAKGVDAYECERSQGWDKSCLNIWKENLIVASSLTGISSIAGFICVVRKICTPPS